MIGLDAIVTLGSLIIPPAVDFVKKKFIKAEQDTPERTVGTLATTKPEILPEYIKGISDMKETAIKFFNRDVIGSPSQWVVDLRAAIRPCGVIAAIIILAILALGEFSGDSAAGVRYSCEAIAGSWFGDRIRLK